MNVKTMTLLLSLASGLALAVAACSDPLIKSCYDAKREATALQMCFEDPRCVRNETYYRNVVDSLAGLEAACHAEVGHLHNETWVRR